MPLTATSTGVIADRVTDLELSRFDLYTVRQPGSTPAEAPAAQDFWVATAQTTAVADLTWEIQDGNYSIVIMNADGSIGIDTEIGGGVGLPGSSAVWELVIVAGAVFVVLGIAVIVVGARRRTTVEVIGAVAPTIGNARGCREASKKQASRADDRAALLSAWRLRLDPRLRLDNARLRLDNVREPVVF